LSLSEHIILTQIHSFSQFFCAKCTEGIVGQSGETVAAEG
jgi:hypothetical protein